MDTQQMMELLLKDLRANQAKMDANQAKADADRVHMQERMEADRKADKKWKPTENMARRDGHHERQMDE
jgi:hypothetical protein